MGPPTGWMCPGSPESYTPGPAACLAELHSMLLSTFQTCPHPSPQPLIKWLFDFPFVIVPCVSSSCRRPPGQGLIGKQNVGVPGVPLHTDPRTPLTRAAGSVPGLLPGRGWRPLSASTVLTRSPHPFLSSRPRADFSSHPFPSGSLLGSCSEFQSSYQGRLQSTLAHSY